LILFGIRLAGNSIRENETDVSACAQGADETRVRTRLCRRLALRPAPTASPRRDPFPSTRRRRTSDTLSSAQFNSALETLTGISIEMTGNANAVYSVATNSTSPFTTTGNSSTTLTLSDRIHHGIDADAERRRHRRFGQCQLIAFDVRGNLFSGIRVGL